MQEAVIAASRLFVAIVGPAWLASANNQAQFATAVKLGKPIRLLVLPGTHLPEDAFQGIADLEVAQSQGGEADAVQIQRWLATLEEQA